MLSQRLFIAFLILTALGASFFMVIEAASFYSRFYPGDDGRLFGYAAAFLNEAFLVIMAAVWLPSAQLGRFKFFHPGNLWVKLLMVFLFVNTVGASSYNLIGDKLNDIQDQDNINAVLKVKEAQLESARSKLSTFSSQNQRVNTAIAARELEKVQEEVAALNAKKKSVLTLWSDIFLLSFLRFSIQISNITAIWLAGWLYRRQRAGLSAQIFHSSGEYTPRSPDSSRQPPKQPEESFVKLDKTKPDKSKSTPPRLDRENTAEVPEQTELGEESAAETEQQDTFSEAEGAWLNPSQGFSDQAPSLNVLKTTAHYEALEQPAEARSGEDSKPLGAGVDRENNKGVPFQSVEQLSALKDSAEEPDQGQSEARSDQAGKEFLWPNLERPSASPKTTSTKTTTHSLHSEHPDHPAEAGTEKPAHAAAATRPAAEPPERGEGDPALNKRPKNHPEPEAPETVTTQAKKVSDSSNKAGSSSDKGVPLNPTALSDSTRSSFEEAALEQPSPASEKVEKAASAAPNKALEPTPLAKARQADSKAAKADRSPKQEESSEKQLYQTPPPDRLEPSSPASAFEPDPEEVEQQRSLFQRLIKGKSPAVSLKDFFEHFFTSEKQARIWLNQELWTPKEWEDFKKVVRQMEEVQEN